MKLKKLAILILAILIIFTLCSCGKKNDTTEQEPQTHVLGGGVDVVEETPKDEPVLIADISDISIDNLNNTTLKSIVTNIKNINGNFSIDENIQTNLIAIASGYRYTKSYRLELKPIDGQTVISDNKNFSTFVTLNYHGNSKYPYELVMNSNITNDEDREEVDTWVYNIIKQLINSDVADKAKNVSANAGSKKVASINGKDVMFEKAFDNYVSSLGYYIVSYSMTFELGAEDKNVITDISQLNQSLSVLDKFSNLKSNNTKDSFNKFAKGFDDFASANIENIVIAETINGDKHNIKNSVSLIIEGLQDSGYSDAIFTVNNNLEFNSIDVYVRTHTFNYESRESAYLQAEKILSNLLASTIEIDEYFEQDDFIINVENQYSVRLKVKNDDITGEYYIDMIIRNMEILSEEELAEIEKSMLENQN